MMNNVFRFMSVAEKTATMITALRADVDVVVSDKGPSVEWKSNGAPKTLHLPNVAENANHQQLSAIQGFIDHESSKVLFACGIDIINPKNKLWSYVYSQIDDVRLNKAMTNRYIGSRANLNSAWEYVHSNDQYNPAISAAYIAANVEAENETESVLTYLPCFFGKHGKSAFNGDKYDALNLHDIFKNIEDKAAPEMMKTLSEINHETDHETIKTLADYFEELIRQEHEDAEDKAPDNSPGEEEGDASSKGESGKKSIDEILAEMQENNMLADMDSEKERQVDVLLEEVRGFRYLTDKFDFVLPTSLLSSYSKSQSKISKIETEALKLNHTLVTAIQAMIEGKKRVYNVGGFPSGKINNGSLHSIKTGNVNLFKRKKEVTFKNGAVSMLVDCSGSMSGTKIQLAIQCAMMIAHTLDHIKANYEINGFTNYFHNSSGSTSSDVAAFLSSYDTKEKYIQGREPYLTYQFKEFGKKFDIHSKRAMMTVLHREGITLGNNEDSKFVLQAGYRLARQPEDKKILIVLSDGNIHYRENFANERAGANGKLKENIKLLEESGISVYGIGIEDETVARYYNNHKICHTLEELPPAILNIIKERYINER